MIHRIPVSVQDRYLVVDSPVPWTLFFNDGKKLDYYSGRYIADLYAPLGSGGHGDEAIRNVFIEYDDRGEEIEFTWQTSEIPVVELTGVNGQIVQLANLPEMMKVEVENIPAVSKVEVENFPVVQRVSLENEAALAVRLVEAGQEIDKTVLKAVYPVGSVYMSFSSEDPAAVFSFGHWTRIIGKFLVGFDSADESFNQLGKEGGEKNVVLTAEQMPNHTHVQKAHSHEAGLWVLNGKPAPSSTAGISMTAGPVKKDARTMDEVAVNEVSGGGQGHNNLPPYVVVNIWYRDS